MSAFNSKNFLKDSLVSPVDRIIKDTSQRLSYKSSDDLGDFASRILFGGAKNSTKSASSLLGNAIVSGLAAEFFGNFNNETNRFTKDQILQNRESNVSIAPSDSTRKLFTNTDSKVLYFPSEDIGKYKMSFSFQKYVRPAPGVQANSTIEKTLFLPIPRNLQESHDIDYSSASTGIAGAVADAIQQISQESSISSSAEAIGGAGAYGAVANRAAMSRALNASQRGIIQRLGTYSLIGNQDVGRVAGQAFGISSNPHLSVLLNGSTLRKHRFSWVFAPETEDESKNLKDTINLFRYASLPVTTEDSTAFFEYPLICKIKFHPWADSIPDSEINVKTGLYTMKTCVVDQFSVNYSPDGSPTFFGVNSEPGYVSFSVDLLEIEYFTANQFGRQGMNITENTFEAIKNLNDIGVALLDVITPDATSPAIETEPSSQTGEQPKGEQTEEEADSNIKSLSEKHDNLVNSFNRQYVNTGDVTPTNKNWQLSSNLASITDYKELSGKIVGLTPQDIKINSKSANKTVINDELERLELSRNRLVSALKSRESRQ
jgi:hypothetical protein